MKHHKFSSKSRQRLSEVEPDLQVVMYLALRYSQYDFGVTCGRRTEEEQQQLYDEGKTTTLNSKHLPNANGFSEAVDLVVYNSYGQVTWEEKYFRKVAEAVFDAAFDLGVHIRWGGHWFSFLDMPHFELKKK